MDKKSIDWAWIHRSSGKYNNGRSYSGGSNRSQSGGRSNSQKRWMKEEEVPLRKIMEIDQGQNQDLEMVIGQFSRIFLIIIL